MHSLFNPTRKESTMKTIFTLALPLIAGILAATYPGIASAAGDKAPTAANSQSMTTSSWDSESEYWRSNYASRPYYHASRSYYVYEPAYRYGYDTYKKYPGKTYDELDEATLRNGWMTARGHSNLEWNDAMPATRDAYMRAYNGKRKATPTSNK